MSSSCEKNTAFRKRKRGIIKKAIEVAQRCDKQVYLAILDPISGHLVRYLSHPD